MLEEDEVQMSESLKEGQVQGVFLVMLPHPCLLTVTAVLNTAGTGRNVL